MPNENLDFITVYYERRVLSFLCQKLRLMRYQWVKRLVYYSVKRKIVDFDPIIFTITVDHPFKPAFNPRLQFSGSKWNMIARYYKKDMLPPIPLLHRGERVSGRW